MARGSAIPGVGQQPTRHQIERQAGSGAAPPGGTVAADLQLDLHLVQLARQPPLPLLPLRRRPLRFSDEIRVCTRRVMETSTSGVSPSRPRQGRRGLPAVDCKRASVRWSPSPSGWLAAAAASSSRFSLSGWPRSPRSWATGASRARSRRAVPGCAAPPAPRSPGPLLRHLVHRRRHGLGVRTGGR